MAAISSTKGLFLILSLLCLVNVQGFLNYQDRAEMMIGNLERAIKEVARRKTEEKDRNEMITQLLDAAKSITDENKLEIFEEYLQEAVDKATRQKADDKDRIEDISNQFDRQVKDLYPSLQLLNMTPSDSLRTRDLLSTVKRLFEKLSSYLDLKKQGFTGKQDTAETLKEILKVLNFQRGVNAEL